MGINLIKNLGLEWVSIQGSGEISRFCLKMGREKFILTKWIPQQVEHLFIISYSKVSIKFSLY